MYQPGSTLLFLDAKTFSEQIVRSVNAALPIGAGNIKGRLKRTTRVWTTWMVGTVQKGTHFWQQDAQNKYEFKLCVDPLRNQEIPLTQSEVDQLLVTKALRAILFKAGNCQEMVWVALIQACQRIAAIPDDKVVPPFSFQIINCPAPVADHVILKVSIDGRHFICDPWLKKVYGINDVNLEAWRKDFEAAEIAPEVKKHMSEREKNSIWDKLKKIIKGHDSFYYASYEVGTREQAKKLAELFERAYEQAVLSYPLTGLFDKRNITPGLTWNHVPLSLVYEQYLNENPSCYYTVQNVKRIKEYIDQFEFPTQLMRSELWGYVRFYLYILSEGGFNYKPSLINMAAIMNTMPFDALCGYGRINIASMDALILYGSCVLFRLDPTSKKATALRNALESRDSVVPICQALLIKQDRILSFWLTPDAWNEMPDKLMSFVKEASEQEKLCENHITLIL